MIPDNLISISAQPADMYFAWQVEVQIVNFRKFDMSDKMHVLVFYKDEISHFLPLWGRLQERYKEVKFFFYKDDGTLNLSLYIPQIRPYMLKKHFEAFKDEFKDKVFFYHDSDIIFNFLPNFTALANGPSCYVSDTTGYLDYNYVYGKEKQGNPPLADHLAVDTLCAIGGITRETMMAYDRPPEGKGSGGAQYILKNIDAAFWADIERMVLGIRTKFYWNVEGSINRTYFSSEDAGFQSWTADMWAVNFALWKRGIATVITPELDFSWASDTADTYKLKPIYHNAGATGTRPGEFFKSAWMEKSPIGADNVTAKKDSASWYYVQAIHEVTSNSRNCITDAVILEEINNTPG